MLKSLNITSKQTIHQITGDYLNGFTQLKSRKDWEVIKAVAKIASYIFLGIPALILWFATKPRATPVATQEKTPMNLDRQNPFNAENSDNPSSESNAGSVANNSDAKTEVQSSSSASDSDPKINGATDDSKSTSTKTDPSSKNQRKKNHRIAKQKRYEASDKRRAEGAKEARAARAAEQNKREEANKANKAARAARQNEREEANKANKAARSADYESDTYSEIDGAAEGFEIDHGNDNSISPKYVGNADDIERTIIKSIKRKRARCNRNNERIAARNLKKLKQGLKAAEKQAKAFAQV